VRGVWCRGSFRLDFSTGLGAVAANPADWYGVHSWLMAVAMGALLPLGVVFLRAGRTQPVIARIWEAADARPAGGRQPAGWRAQCMRLMCV
jgi:hypothetical protein